MIELVVAGVSTVALVVAGGLLERHHRRHPTVLPRLRRRAQVRRDGRWHTLR